MGIQGNLWAGGFMNSNLLFWLIAHSPMTLVERWRHGYDAFPDAGRTQPFGSGATVVFNHRDLRFLTAQPPAIKSGFGYRPAICMAPLTPMRPSMTPFQL